MWEIIRRKIKVPLIILGVVLLLLFLVFLSVKIVKIGGKTESLVKEEKIEEVQDQEIEEEDEKEFIQKDSKKIEDKTFAKTSRLFDEEDLEERQLKFLGDNFNTLKPALDTIESEFKGMFADIGEVTESSYDWDRVVDISKVETDIFSEEFLNGDSIAYDPIGGTIVGMYGTHCIVYQVGYNTDYASDLIAIDYSDMHIDTEQIGLFGFGQGKSFFIDPRYAKLVDHGDFKILYARGY